MPYDPSKTKPDPALRHSVSLRLEMGVYAKLEDGQLHGVAACTPSGRVFEVTRANAAVAKEAMNALWAELQEVIRRHQQC